MAAHKNIYLLEIKGSLIQFLYAHLTSLPRKKIDNLSKLALEAKNNEYQ